MARHRHSQRSYGFGRFGHFLTHGQHPPLVGGGIGGVCLGQRVGGVLAGFQRLALVPQVVRLSRNLNDPKIMTLTEYAHFLTSFVKAFKEFRG